MAFCGLCGKEVSDGQTFCRECNNELANPKTKAPDQEEQKGTPIVIFCFISAGITFILSLLGGIQILIGAEGLTKIFIASGYGEAATTAVTFYNRYGTILGGLGLFIIAFGFFAGAFLTYCGYKNIKSTR